MKFQILNIKTKGYAMHTHFRTALIATTAVLALGAFTAHAAPPATSDATVTIAQTGMPGDHDMLVKVEQRITDLQSTLKITTAQQPRFDGFAEVMRDNAKAMDASFRQRVVGMPAMNAADNLQSYADVAMQHALGMQKMVPAFRALYAVLTDDQKRMADEEFVENAHHGIDKPKG